MYFYGIVANIENEESYIKEWSSRKNQRTVRDLTEKFNQKTAGEAYFFIEDANEVCVTAGLITKECRYFENAEAFFKRIGLNVSNIGFQETTFRTIRDSLNTSDCRGFIRDEDEILERFGIDLLSRPYRRNFTFDEKIIDFKSKKQIFREAEQLFAKEQFTEELERIYSHWAFGKSFGHPVHYMLMAENDSSLTDMVSVLVPALFANGRVRSHRYCTVTVERDDSITLSCLEALYKSCTYGTVVINVMPMRVSDDSYASEDVENISKICRTMKKYRNSVQTVFGFHRESAKIRKLFYEELESLSFIEITETPVTDIRAKEYIKSIARKHSVRTNKKLLSMIEEDRYYNAEQLNNIFDEWYDDKLKNEILPQYKDIHAKSEELKKGTPKGSAFDELDRMTGLTEAKSVIRKAVNYYKAQKLFKEKGMKTDNPAMHMVFTGNPGTAKTTAARLFARIMNENGLLSSGKIIEVGRSDLVGKYVGWTANIVKNKFKEAKGGVLFIDEAYSLVDGRDGLFGDEAINTIVQEMENCREDTVVIFAGYPDEMEAFLQKNPGLRSRIAFHIPFADYNTAELCDIAELIAEKKGLILSDGAKEKLIKIFDNARLQSDFGNGRYVRNIIEKAKMSQAERLISMDYDDVSQADIKTICADDIEMPVFCKTETVRIGF